MPRSTAEMDQAWLECYRLAEEYFHQHGDLLIPDRFVCQGKRLGTWIAIQRSDYKNRTNRRFTQARIDLLNAIGMVWDVKQFHWDAMCRELKHYLQLRGTTRVPQSYVTPEGVKLGVWLNKARMDFKRGRLSQERQAQLEGLGVVWNPEVLRRENWDRCFRLLEEYVARVGSFPPAGYVTEEGVKLGIWLSNQRKNGRDGTLLPTRRQKLEELGISWDMPEQNWLSRWRQAKAYYRRWGHLCPYQSHDAPLPSGLSQWLGAQRKARLAGTLSPEKIHLLEEVGMVWDVFSHLWESSYQQAETYYHLHGHLRVSKDSGPDSALGHWISTQRKCFKLGKLSAERVARLDQIGMVWDAGVDSEALWEDWFRTAQDYYLQHGHLNPKPGKLRTWLLAQRAAKRGKRGHLTGDQIRRLEEIGMVWEPLTDRWQAMYQHAVEYHQVHQMLNIPCGYITESGARLGQWITRQRHCYRNYLTGNMGHGRGSITPERIALLNQLGMIWDGTQTTARTSFPEKALLFYLRQHFPDAAKLSQWQALGAELDVYIPSIQTAVEYDGLLWHSEKAEQDEEKGALCRRHGIRLIRLREPGLPPVFQCDLVIWLDSTEDSALEGAISTLFHHLALPLPHPDLARDRPAILETYRNFTARAWDRAYRALHRHHSIHGSLALSPGTTDPGGLDLAGWLHAQREAYRDNQLTALQVRKLEALGIQWAPFEDRWQRMYQLAADYAQAHGDLMIPHDHTTDQGVRLGAWLAHQRELYRKEKLDPRRINLLESLGILWEPCRTRQQTYLAAARAFRLATGGLSVPTTYVTEDGLALGEWLRQQRRRHQAGRLSASLCKALEEMDIQWEDNAPCQQSVSARWEEMFALAQDYRRKYGHLWPSPDYVTPQGHKLGQWVARQRQKYRGVGRHAPLTPDQRRRLEGLGMVWDPYTEKWMKKYRLAQAYYQAHGHLNIPSDYVTSEGVKLGMWLSCQRQAMRGNPNFLMTPERQRLLDTIGMDWTLQYTRPNARRRI